MGARRDRECIGEIRGFGELREIEHGLDRELHLLFGRSPRSSRCFFDLSGFELDDLDPSRTRREQDHAASVRHLDDCPGMVLVREHPLNCDQIGFHAFDELDDILMEFNQPIPNRRHGLPALGESEDPRFDDGWADQVSADAAVAGDGEAGIESEDTHGISIVDCSGLGDQIKRDSIRGKNKELAFELPLYSIAFYQEISSPLYNTHQHQCAIFIGPDQRTPRLIETFVCLSGQIDEDVPKILHKGNPICQHRFHFAGLNSPCHQV